MHFAYHTGKLTKTKYFEWDKNKGSKQNEMMGSLM